MTPAVALQQPARLPQTRAAGSAARGGRKLAAAARSQTQAVREASAPPEAAVGVEASNIVEASQLELGSLTAGQRSKLELQQEALAALEADNAWWREDGGAGAPANLVTATTPAEYKRLIVGAPASQLVVVDYLKPSCGGCRRLHPKLLQIAASNPDALFIKVNVDTPEMRDLGQGMGVAHLPWFHLFRAGEMVASFSANLTTVGVLRAEIAANKACEDPGCALDA